MKKSIKYFLLMASMFSFAISCVKDIPYDNEAAPVHLTLVAGNPEAVPASKTEMRGSTPYWCPTDAIGVTDAVSTNDRFNADLEFAATTATFSGTTVVSSELFAYYLYSAAGLVSSGSRTGIAVDLPAEQHPLATSFDGDADIMVARRFSVDAATTVEHLQFARLGAIVKVVLKDNDALLAGQHVSRLTVTADSLLAGRVLIDLQAQELLPPYENFSSSVSAVYNESTRYQINGSDATYLVVYPYILEEGGNLRIEAETEDYTIIKEIVIPAGGIELQAGKVTTLNISVGAANISGGTEGPASWSRVSSVDELLSGGTFIIGYEATKNSGVIVPMANKCSASAGSNGFMYSGASASSGGKDTIDMANVTETADYEVTIGPSSTVSGAVYIKAGDYYLGNNNVQNKCQLYSSEAAYTAITPTLSSGFFTLSINSNASYKYLKYNTSSPRFAFYSTTPANIVIYKKSGGGITPPPQQELKVTTQGASNIGAAEATLLGAFSGAEGGIYEAGFYWGTSPSNLSESITTDGTNDASGTFSCQLIGLEESSVYYFKAYVLHYNSDTQTYEESFGEVQSFSTKSSTAAARGYLNCYEVPAIPNLTGTGTNGYFSDRDDRWYRYYTTNSRQQVATHTFTHPDTNKKTRNYTVLYDQNKYAPLWTAHAMHSSMWPDKNAGRNDGWTNDPAINLTQQTGVSSYSKGHLVASNYRQSSVKQNKQTFYYTNQAPQWQNGFNGGIWSTLESDVKSHAPSGRDTLYVVTGVLYEGTTKTEKSGSLVVPIPSHFYKCLMKCSFDASGNITAAKGCAYVYTNESHSGSYSSGHTSIDSIELRAGFDFFPNVPSALQDSAEAQKASIW